jgi:arginase family enzyme
MSNLRNSQLLQQMQAHPLKATLAKALDVAEAFQGDMEFLQLNKDLSEQGRDNAMRAKLRAGVMYAGLDAWMPVEGAVINTLGLRRAGSDSLAETSAPVLNWIADEGVAYLAIHFDVDVLDPTKFGPVLFNKPDVPADAWADVPRGRMSPDHVVRLLQDVAAACDVVGLAIAEYMPWEAITMHNMLRKRPILAARSDLEPYLRPCTDA